MGVRKVILGKRVKEYWLVDPESGEVVEDSVKVLAYIPRVKEKEEFSKVFKTLWIEVLNNPKLKGAPLKVLVWLMNQNSWGNEWIYMDYKEVARELRLSEVTVKLAVKTLKDANLIIQKKPREKLFRLNPKYVYIGSATQRKEDIDF